MKVEYWNSSVIEMPIKKTASHLVNNLLVLLLRGLGEEMLVLLPAGVVHCCRLNLALLLLLIVVV